MMNRDQLRRIQHLPAAKFYEVIKGVVEEEVEKQKSYTFYNLAASMFTALRERYPDMMTGDMMHSIAVDTCDISNGLETPAELDAKLSADTGFSVYEPPSESLLNYIPKGEQDG